MNKFWRTLAREQRGSTIVLAGLAMTLLLAVTGLVVDGGTLYATKSRMQKAANAAALSGAQKLVDDPSVVNNNVNAVVNEILDKNGEKTSLEKTTIQGTNSNGVRGNASVRVRLKRDVPLGFAGLLGMRTAVVSVEAAAQLVPLAGASGLVPIGIEDTQVLVYGQVDTLKFDEKNNPGHGWFGILDMEGKGGSVYRDLLANGTTETFSVGDVLGTVSGNKVGPTRQGIQERLDKCKYVNCDPSNPDSPRIILVPIYHVPNTNGKTTEVTIVGFASFYITDPEAKDKDITGMFLRKIESGLTKPGTVDGGTYGIKLIE